MGIEEPERVTLLRRWRIGMDESKPARLSVIQRHPVHTRRATGFGRDGHAVTVLDHVVWSSRGFERDSEDDPLVVPEDDRQAHDRVFGMLVDQLAQLGKSCGGRDDHWTSGDVDRRSPKNLL